MGSDVVLIGAQERVDERFSENNSNIFKYIPPYFIPFGRDILKAAPKAQSFNTYAIPLLGAMARKHGYSVFGVNDFFSCDKNELKREIQHADLAVGLSTTFLTSFESIRFVTKFIKETNPEIPLMVGGPGIINFPESRKLGDINIFYEGDLSFISVLNELKSKNNDFKNISGISYVLSGTENITTDRPVQIPDLNVIPTPDWDITLNKSTYQPYLPIEASRGCIAKCSFCLETRYWEGVRYFSLGHILDELKKDKDLYGTRAFYFQESNMGNSKKKINELCQAIINEKLNILWGCECRIDGLDDKILDLMYESGCRCITFGVESSSDQVLQNMKKGISREKLLRKALLIQKMKRLDMLANINIIVGFPGETAETIEETISFLKEFEPITYSLAKFFLERATPIYEEKEKYGIRGEGYSWSHDTMRYDELDIHIRYIFQQVSSGLKSFHWPSGTIELLHHLGLGKSLEDFKKYLKAFHVICLEDLAKEKDAPYSKEYADSFDMILNYFK